MAVLKYPEFLKRLQKGEKPVLRGVEGPVLSGVEGIEPLYLFYGEERFLVEEGVQRLKEKVLDPSTADFNLSLFREEDRSAARVTDAALTFPVLAPMRLVVVHGMDAWPKGETERLSAYFSNPSPTTCLVLTAGKVDERKSPLLAAVSARGTAVSCPPLFERELEGWISARLRKAGKTASSDAVAFWTASIGSDLHRLAAELDKAAAFVGERKEITEEDTAQLMAGGRQVSAFEFVAALGGRDVRAALPLLKKALDGGVPVEILGVILWNFRTLGRVLEWVDQGFSPEAAAKKAGIPPFTSKKILPQVRGYRLAEMPDLFASFLEADLAIKGGSPLPPERILEDLVRRVCGRG